MAKQQTSVVLAFGNYNGSWRNMTYHFKDRALAWHVSGAHQGDGSHAGLEISSSRRSHRPPPIRATRTKALARSALCCPPHPCQIQEPCINKTQQSSAINMMPRQATLFQTRLATAGADTRKLQARTLSTITSHVQHICMSSPNSGR